MRSVSSYDLIPKEYSDNIKNNIWQPVHYYALRISPIPIKTSDNEFLQLTYSESYFKISNNSNKILLSSRPAIQQYTKISNANNIPVPENCFSTLFAFYISWFPYIDKNITFSNYDSEECPFYVPNDVSFNFTSLYKKPFSSLKEQYIPFFVKKNTRGVYEKYGKINKYAPAYRIIIGE